MIRSIWAFGAQEGVSNFLVNGSSLQKRRFVVANQWGKAMDFPEASSLIALCEDLDWESCVDDLRREAAAALVKKNAKKIQQDQSITNTEEPDWDFKAAISDLRRRASYQAAEELAKQNHSADFDKTVSRIADHIFCQLQQPDESKGDDDRNGLAGIDKAAAMLLSIFTGFQGWLLLANAETVAETSSAQTPSVPSWLPPTVLGFPVASYLIFNLYREKVNPEAKITDFFFAVGAMFIVGNLITSATLGVRLY